MQVKDSSEAVSGTSCWGADPDHLRSPREHCHASNPPVSLKNHAFTRFMKELKRIKVHVEVPLLEIPSPEGPSCVLQV
jgi:hypothetical protein